MTNPNSYTWTILEKRVEAPGVFSLVLEAQGERPAFIGGQYLTVRIPGFEPAEGKSYSVSSIPSDIHLTLTIKEMGAFSRALLAHTVGDTLATSAPYGFFYPDEPRAPAYVFIAGGIGITPCMSMMCALLEEDSETHITLLYSNKTTEGIVFKDALASLAHSHPHLHIHHFITDPSPRVNLGLGEGEMHQGRISKEALYEHSTPDADIFVCGSIDFTKSMWALLRELGTPTSKIYTEGFF
jgi:ring-1,2-phenylacetyl-CoA epoxidase subunit PaaE